jgi:hypothetical protein
VTLYFHQTILTQYTRIRQIYALLGYYAASCANYHAMPHNIPEECRSHQHGGRSLKSMIRRTEYVVWNSIIRKTHKILVQKCERKTLLGKL